MPAAWEKGKDGAAPKLKGATCFSFDEMKLMTNNFGEANILGEGGYGQVISIIWLITGFFFFPCDSRLISTGALWNLLLKENSVSDHMHPVFLQFSHVS